MFCTCFGFRFLHRVGLGLESAMPRLRQIGLAVFSVIARSKATWQSINLRHRTFLDCFTLFAMTLTGILTLLIFSTLSPAHGSSSSQEILQDEIKQKQTKEGMTSLLGLVSETTIAGEVLKYLTPPDIESLRVSRTKDHPDDTKEMKDLKTKFKKLESVIKSFNKAYVIRRTTVTNLSKRPEMTTLFKGLVVEAHHEDHLRDLKYISYALAQKLDLSLLNYLEATVEDLGALETLLGKASQRAQIHLNVRGFITGKPQAALWKNPLGRSSVSLKFQKVSNAVDFLIPLSETLKYNECPDLYVYVDAITEDNFETAVEPLNSLIKFFHPGLRVHTYANMTDYSGIFKRSFVKKVAVRNARLFAAIKGDDPSQLPLNPCAFTITGCHISTLADVQSWALRVDSLDNVNSFISVMCGFANVPKHHRKTVCQYAKDINNPLVYGPDVLKTPLQNETVGSFISFLSLFAFGDESLLDTYKADCRDLAIEDQGERIYEELVKVPAEERYEVLYRSYFSSSSGIRGNFGENPHRSNKIKWLSFMPKGKRKEFWTKFYNEAQAFIVKYPSRSIYSVLNDTTQKVYLHGNRYEPGFFPIVETVVSAWVQKNKDQCPDVEPKQLTKIQAVIIEYLLPFFAALPADQREETAQLLSKAPVPITKEDIELLLKIEEPSRLPTMRAADQYVFPEMFWNHYSYVLRFFYLMPRVNGQIPFATMDPILKKYQAAILGHGKYRRYPHWDFENNFIAYLEAIADTLRLQAIELLQSAHDSGLCMFESECFLACLYNEKDTNWKPLTEKFCELLKAFPTEKQHQASAIAIRRYDIKSLPIACGILQRLIHIDQEYWSQFNNCFYVRDKSPLTLDQVLDDAVKALNRTNPATS